MFHDIQTPRGRHWAVPLLAAVLFAAYGARTGPAASLWWWLVAAVFCGWALVNFVHHAAHAVSGILREQREIEFKSGQNYYVEMLSKMNAEQIKALRAGIPMVELIPTENGRIEKMYGFECYDALTYYIIIHSDNRRVYPINNFTKGTFHWDVIGDHELDDNKQAHNVHAWLCWMGFAEWGRGNEPCHWKNGFTPDTVLARLGWTREEPAGEESA